MVIFIYRCACNKKHFIRDLIEMQYILRLYQTNLVTYQ